MNAFSFAVVAADVVVVVDGVVHIDADVVDVVLYFKCF